ncbi:MULTISPECIES: hypothetical protein [unclassified Nesterenkonia]|uniref:hypothetical protein n=1 Tax=unclassified Nesterenkonia TaxID=2629769 RepID=UPI001F4CEEEF|nr:MULTISPECIES: hypothetical protein [unclassified Nesterenkonia]MCH8561390.1 hypothetical protein [Nesterenkonia sp. DZ6]MCH8562297.1 hypothetical protein [Nesterenkonia sp. YGD6]MCH8571151.1 hypothetical protein [Nesterenkonia sp. AY15]
MSTSFVVMLIAVVLALLVFRWVAPGLPLERVTRRLTVLDLLLIVLGVLGLILHCAAMFFRSWVAAVPGTGGVINQINSMGVASMVWYAVPALLVMIGLRRQHWIGLVLLAASLLAVGVTMYDGSTLSIHLATIFIAGVMIAAVLLLLSTPPWARPTSPTPAEAC